MTAKRAQKGVLARLPKRLETARHDAEKAARRMWNEAVDLLPAAPRKAMRRFTHEFERTTTGLRRRVERARVDVEKRAERLVKAATQRAEKALTPMVHRLDVASRSDVDRLRKRVTALERRLEGRHAPVAA